LLVMVWDGMRPDLISPELTPNLVALASRGVTFDANHAVVPTVTRINAATLATGAPSSTHGLPGNTFFAPRIDLTGPISVGEGDNVAQLRRAYGVFAAPTMADVIRANGGRTTIVSSGTRGSSQMLHPRRTEVGDLIVHPTLSTREELAPFVELLGPLPDLEVPDTTRNLWLAQATAQIIIPEHRPEAIFFWHDDPDKTQHAYGFGHPRSIQAIRDADAHLGMVLESLDATGTRDETLVVVASDHGYVGIHTRLDLQSTLAPLESENRVVIAPNGCAALLYQERHDERQLADIARHLRAVPGVDVLFSGARGSAVVPGTFPLDLLRMDGPLAPDLLVTLAWSDDPNVHGHPGVSYEHGGNHASHGGASAWEIRNMLIVAGPGIRSGARSALPSGTIDLAPTLLTALGLPVPESMVGRILEEASEFALPPQNATPSQDATVWEQLDPAGTLRWSEYRGHRYLDAAWRPPLPVASSST
jgi:arylsulfatase A-like enzyme